MTDKQSAARAIGYLQGMSAVLWIYVCKDLSAEFALAYDEAVETLRKALFKDDEKGGQE